MDGDVMISRASAGAHLRLLEVSTYLIDNLETAPAQVEFELAPGEGQEDTIWEVTTRAEASCVHPSQIAVSTEPTGNPVLYRALIGLRTLDKTASLSGVVFQDANANGTRDDGEIGTGGVQVDASPGEACRVAFVEPTYSYGDGTFQMDLPPGSWNLSAIPNGRRSEFVYRSAVDTIKLQLESGRRTGIELGYDFQGPNDLRVRVIEDSDANGSADINEQPLAAFFVCLEWPDRPFEGTCVRTNDSGFASFIGIPDGASSVYVRPTFSGFIVVTPAQAITTAGGVTSLTFLVRRIGTTGIPNCTAVSC
jgi:hypothetical protein